MARRPSILTDAKARLASQQGASFLVALAVFLVCAMVAASVISAASANAQKSSGVQSAQQTYLTLSSAARLLADDLDQTGYAATGSVRAPEHTCSYLASHAGSQVTEENLVVTDSAGAASSSALAQLLAEGVAAINPYDFGTSYTRSFTVKVDEFSDVDAVFTMYGADGVHGVYDIEIELLSTSERNPASVVVSAKASTETKVITSVETGTCSHYDQWQFAAPYDQQALLDPSWGTANTPAFDVASGNYVVQANDYGQAIATTSPIRDTTSQQTISWGRAYIAKGQVQ